MKRGVIGRRVGKPHVSDTADRYEQVPGPASFEDRYRALSEGSLFCVFLMDLDGRFVDVNDTTLNLLGYTRTELTGLNFTALHSWEDLPQAMAVFDEVRQRGSHDEPKRLRVKRKDGSFVWLELESCLVRHGDKPVGVQGIARDITAQKQAEEQLQEQQRIIRESLEFIPDLFAVFSLDGSLLFWNQAKSRVTGYSHEEMAGMKISDFFHASEHQRLAEGMRQGLKSGTVEMELPLVTRQGESIPYEFKGTLLRNPGGHVIGFCGIGRDISHRKQFEQKMAGEKESLWEILASMGEGVITADTHARIAFMNREAEHLTGWTRQEAQGRPLNEVFRTIHTESTPPFEQPMNSVLGGPVVCDRHHKTTLVTSGGARRTVMANLSPVRSDRESENGVVLAFQDITETQEIENEVLKMQKLECIGVLAGGLAHEFNNILTIIAGNVGLAKMHIDPENQAIRMLEDAENTSIRARDLTTQLLAFSCGGRPTRRPITLASLLHDTAVFTLSGSDVRPEFCIPSDLWRVDGDAIQIQQLLNNLFMNALQATPAGGVVDIRAANHSTPHTRDVLLHPGKYVEISIEDHGIGIPEEHLSKLFDPYFTTKPDRGLGLTTAYAIVKRHDGLITLQSKPGEGTTLHVYLPASESEVLEAQPPEEEIVFGSGRILVMDDEEMVRTSASEILRHLGYEVDCAGDGEVVLQVYQNTLGLGAPYDVVILDLTVPGRMGGLETLHGLQALDPKVTALVSSGYTNDPVLSRFKDYGFAGAISKPYRIEHLGKSLHDVMLQREARKAGNVHSIAG